MINSRQLLTFAIVLSISGCARLGAVGKVPDFSDAPVTDEYVALTSYGLPTSTSERRFSDDASLWKNTHKTFLQNRKASIKGDIVTVVIEIDDEAQLSNTSDRARSGSEELRIDEFLGLPQNLSKQLPIGAGQNTIVNTDSQSESEGRGNISRREKLALRVAATVIGEMPNGVLQISGTQEVRVNYELRELTVSGFVRPEDISRKNEVNYDRLASARISYGGRGQISDVQQPRYGQQISDIILPF